MITQENIPYTADEIKAMVKTCEKYNKALERAKDMLAYKEVRQEDMEYLFPELEESEDERMSREIIDFLRLPHRQFAGKRYHEKWIAWLEKQGKEEYALKSFKDEDIRKFMQYIEKQAKAYEFNLPNRGYDIYAFAKDILYYLERQGEQKRTNKTTQMEKCSKCQFVYTGYCNGTCILKNNEQKSVDNVEPKFHEGDWITDGRITCKVLGVTGKSYELHLHNDDYCHFETDIQSVDKCYRLWTIQDAKDGDVLYSIDSKQPFIYKERPQFSQARGYCCINKFGEFAIWNTSKCVICTDKYIPATKEQRDLLFRKMKEAEYEWDSEKKELKKIEVTSKESKDERMMEQLCDFLRDNMLYQDAQEITSWLEKLLEKH